MAVDVMERIIPWGEGTHRGNNPAVLIKISLILRDSPSAFCCFLCREDLFRGSINSSATNTVLLGQAHISWKRKTLITPLRILCFKKITTEI